jgi:HEAT repeat protein
LSERFVTAVARAFEDGFEDGSGNAVATPLRYAIDGLAKNDPLLAIGMVGAFCREAGQRLAGDAANLCRANLAAAIVSESTLRAVLEALENVTDENRDRCSNALKTILDSSDAVHFSVVLAHVGPISDRALRELCIGYLARVGEGHEAEMGQLFGTADLELGLALVRILANIKSRAAREAISHAARSPHAVVRIEALGHVEGVSSERLRLELRGLLEDKEPGVRLAALEAMAKYGIRVAGPFLVLRVRAPEFDALPLNERHQAFATLVALAPNRAESAALEVANDRRLVSSDPHETSREIATEVLGRIGVTSETREALMELKTARLRNSDRVRAAAARALDVFESRALLPADAENRESGKQR